MLDIVIREDNGNKCIRVAHEGPNCHLTVIDSSCNTVILKLSREERKKLAMALAVEI